MQIMIAFFTLGSFRWEVLMLAACSFPIYTKALWNAICRKEQSWHVTGQAGRASSPFNFMVPQVLFFWFLLLTTAVGAWKDWNSGTFSLALAWNATNALILGTFVLTAMREARTIARDNRAESKREKLEARGERARARDLGASQTAAARTTAQTPVALTQPGGAA